MLKKLLVCVSLVSFVNVIGADTSKTSSVDKKNKEPISSLDEFQPLSEPYRYISGAYCGAGVGYAFIPLKINTTYNDVTTEYKKKKAQPEIFLTAGFGSSFYKDYYAGLEMEFCKKFSKRKSYHKDGVYGVEHRPTFGLGMSVRFGYQMPLYKSMIYGSIGFSKLIGRSYVKHEDKEYTASFGSYSPTLGLGIERRINYNWNIRLEGLYSVPKKKTKDITRLETVANDQVTKHVYETKGRISRFAIRVYVTRTF